MGSLVSIRFNNLLSVVASALLIVATLPSCNTNTPANDKTADTTASTSVISATDSVVGINQDSTDNAILYFTIADTGKSYYTLRNEMYVLHTSLGWVIDTMGRYYNAKKDLIAVPDNDEDEMYRGEYYPRRYPGENLSLEYYRTYIPASTEKNIALVAGIFESQKSADSLLTILKPHAPHAFVIKANVFEGCMH